MTKSCVLFSGGLDSYIAWKLFARNADLVLVNIGQAYLAKETDAAWAIAKAEGVKLHQLDATQIGKGPAPNGIILHRNALLILTAASYYNNIVMGVLADEINSDKSREFFDAMEEALNISHREQYWNNGIGIIYAIHSPIRSWTKSELVELYLERGHDPTTLLKTVSCYDGAHGHCGACPSCFKRWVALVNNGLPVAFRNDPVAWAKKSGVLVKARDGTYGEARAAEILKAVG